MLQHPLGDQPLGSMLGEQRSQLRLHKEATNPTHMPHHVHHSSTSSQEQYLQSNIPFDHSWQGLASEQRTGRTRSQKLMARSAGDWPHPKASTSRISNHRPHINIQPPQSGDQFSQLSTHVFFNIQEARKLAKCTGSKFFRSNLKIAHIRH